MSRRVVVIWVIVVLVGVSIAGVLWISANKQSRVAPAAANRGTGQVASQRKTERDMDLEVIANSVRHGDLVDVPRAIEHYAYFTNLASGEQFVVWCKESGFRVDKTAPREEGGWVVRFSKVGPLTIEEVTAQRETAAKYAASAGCVYDGWETVIVRKRK